MKDLYLVVREDFQSFVMSCCQTERFQCLGFAVCVKIGHNGEVTINKVTCQEVTAGTLVI